MADPLEDVFADIDTGLFDPTAPSADTVPGDDVLEQSMAVTAGQATAFNGIAAVKGREADPDKYTEQKALGERFGVDVGFVRRNTDAVKSKAAQEDIAKLLVDNPEVAKWYGSDDNTAAIKVDELRHLTGLRWLWDAGTQSFQAGSVDVDLAGLRYRQLMGMATGEEIERADQLSSSRQARAYGADSWLEKGFVGALAQAPILAKTFVGGLEGGLLGGGAAAGTALILGQVGPQIALPEELVTVPGSAVAGFKLGATLGQWNAAMELETGLAYDEFKALKDENGVLLEDGVARIGALVAGSSAAIFEVYGFKKLAALLPGTDDVLSVLGKEGVKRALQVPSVRNALGAFAKRTLVAGVTEITTEIAQEAIVVLAGEMSKVVANQRGGSFAGVSADEVSERLKETAIHTAQTMTILGPVLSGTKLGLDLKRARNAAKDAGIVAALNDHAENSELNKRVPDKAQDAVTKLTENGPLQNVLISAQGLTEYFQTTEEASAFANSVGLIDEYNEAVNTGRDMELPVGVYYAKIAGTEIGRALQPHTKLSPENMTQAEATVFNEAWDDARAALEEEFTADLEADRVALEGGEVVFDDVKRRAMDAGIVPDQAQQYAQLYSTFFETMAARTGQDAATIYQRYGFQIRREIAGEKTFQETGQTELALEMIRRGQIDVIRKEIQKQLGPSILQVIQDRGGVRDEAGELAARDVPGRFIAKPKEDSGQGELLGKTEKDDASNEASLDATTLALWEAGYFPEFTERPDTETLLTAIDDELAGSPRFAVDGSAVDARQGLVDFADALDELGLDPVTMSDEEIVAQLDQVQSESGGNELFQTAPALDSTAFAEWFGDSKVVDEKGDPLAVWHGSSQAGFGQFQTDGAGKTEGTGAFFTQSSLGALTYSGTRDEFTPVTPSEVAADPEKFNIEVQQQSPEDGGGVIVHSPAGFEYSAGTLIEALSEMDEQDGLHEEQRGNYQVYLSIQNPLIIDAGGRNWDAVGAEAEFFAKDADGEVVDYFTNEEDATHAMEFSDEIVEIEESVSPDGASTDDIVREAREFGDYDGVIITNVTDEGPHGQGYGWDDTVYVAFEPGQIKSVSNIGAFDRQDPRILFQTPDEPKGMGTRKGSIQLAHGKTIINMFETADLSTFLHESGHFFLEIFRDLAEAAPDFEIGPPTQIQADWLKLQEFLGVSEDGKISETSHEKFARTFERYLFDGKAPSNAVSSAMARFRSWLVFVYKQAKAINAPITQPIIDVIDRMIATDEEIATARTGAEFRPAFTSANEAGMTPAQYDQYLETAARAVDKAKSELDVKLMTEVARESRKEWKDARRTIRAVVDEEYRALPVYRVWEYLRTGQSENVPEGVGRMTLDAKEIENVIGEGALNKMPRGVPPLYRRKGGVHPDIVAEFFDFQSGHDMLQALMSASPLKKAVDEETDLRMRHQFGDLMGDAVARSREAEASIANDATGDLLQAEMGVLVRLGLVSTKLNKQDAQKTARGMVRSKTIREAIRFRLYMNANRKAAEQAEKAIRQQDWVTAVGAKKRQLLNHYLAIEARDAEADVTKAVTYLNKFTARKPPKNVDPEYLEQIHGLLERFDLRKSISNKEAQRRTSLAEWITAQEEQGALVTIPDALRNDAFRKPYREMSVDDLMALRDTIKNIEHLGRLKSKLLANKEQREFEAAQVEMVDQITESQAERAPSETRNPTKKDEFISQAKSLEAALLKMEQVVDWMDQGDVNGPLHRFIWEPLVAAENRENDMNLEYTAKFISILDKLDKGRLAERITIQGLDQTFTRSEIIAVALNTGNEQNLDKMLRGETWTEDTIDLITSHLNEQEWQAVQDVWNTVNELWPEIAALQKRLTGVEPAKVEARKVDTPFGTLDGGYYPLIYDPNRSHDVEDRSAAAADRMFENTYLRPETRHGFTKERNDAYARPLLFDLDGAGGHVKAVIHDLTHREAIIDANKLLTSSFVRTRIEQTYGPEIYKQFVPWLQSIAHDAYRDDGLKAVDQMMKSVRSRATIMGMGFRISTILTQLAGFSSALEMVGTKAMVGAIKDFTIAPQQSWERVHRLSGQMRHRSTTLDRDIRDQIRQLTGKTGLADDARRFAFYGIGLMDKVVTVPTWMAAYNEHMRDTPGDHDGAMAHADRAIRLTQGSGGPKDLAAVSRKNEMSRLLTMFYSYFSAYYNRQRTWGREAHSAIKRGDYREFPDLLARQVFMTVGPAVVAELLVGRGPDEDDDEGYAEWAARKVVFYPISAVPIVRDAVGVFDRGFGYTFTPAAQTIDALLVRPFQLVGDALEGDLDTRKALKQTIQTTGYATKLPLGQVASSVDNVWKALENDDFKIRDLVLTRQHK